MKVECDSKAVDFNQKYDEGKRQTVIEKLIWRAGMKDSNSKDRARNNIISTNYVVECHSKYISNQKYCWNPLNQERHGSVKKSFVVFTRLCFKKFALSQPDSYYTYIYIYIYI